MINLKKTFASIFYGMEEIFDINLDPIENPVQGSDKERLMGDWNKIAGDFNKTYNTLIQEFPDRKSRKQEFTKKQHA